MALVKCNASFSYPTAGGPRTIAVGELLDESDPAVTARRSFFSPTTAESLTQTGGLADGSVTAAKLAADALAAAVAAGATTYALLAPDWIADRAYIVGELVVSSGFLYRCTTAHTSAVSFDGSKFTAVAVSTIDGGTA